MLHRRVVLFAVSLGCAISSGVFVRVLMFLSSSFHPSFVQHCFIWRSNLFKLSLILVCSLYLCVCFVVMLIFLLWKCDESRKPNSNTNSDERSEKYGNTSISSLARSLSPSLPFCGDRRKNHKKFWLRCMRKRNDFFTEKKFTHILDCVKTYLFTHIQPCVFYVKWENGLMNFSVVCFCHLADTTHSHLIGIQLYWVHGSMFGKRSSIQSNETTSTMKSGFGLVK